LISALQIAAKSNPWLNVAVDVKSIDCDSHVGPSLVGGGEYARPPNGWELRWPASLRGRTGLTSTPRTGKTS
jgi:hypothetical protein